jgi:hypothetical protein
MAITLDDYVDEVFFQLGRGRAEKDAMLYRSSIYALSNNALRLLADSIAQAGPEKRVYLQKNFNFTLSGGAVSIPLTSTIIPEWIPSAGYVTLSGITNPLLWLPYRSDLDTPPPLGSDFTFPQGGFYTLFGQTVIVRDVTKAVPTQTALSINSIFNPLISEVPDDLVKDLVNIGVSLVLTAGQPQAPPPPQQSGNPQATGANLVSKSF